MYGTEKYKSRYVSLKNAHGFRFGCNMYQGCSLESKDSWNFKQTETPRFYSKSDISVLHC